MFQLTPIVRSLLLLNVGIFLLERLLGISLAYVFGLRYFESPDFAPYQFLTYMFAHADFFHLFGNMFALAIFGPALEMAWGFNRFLTFYLVCGLGAALLHMGINAYELHYMGASEAVYFQTLIGASGAIFGILTAFGLTYPDTELFMFPIPFPIKAKYMVFIWGGIELMAIVNASPGDNVARFAHLGGMLLGFVMVRIWRSSDRY